MQILNGSAIDASNLHALLPHGLVFCRGVGGIGVGGNRRLRKGEMSAGAVGAPSNRFRKGW
jgi:hypothetical protein